MHLKTKKKTPGDSILVDYMNSAAACLYTECYFFFFSFRMNTIIY